MNQLENKNPKIKAKFIKDDEGIDKIVGLIVGDKNIDFLNKEKQEPLEYLDNTINEILGFPNFMFALDVLYDFAKSLPFGLHEDTFNNMLALLAAQKPCDSVEAILIGQFFLLNQLGTNAWRNCHKSEFLLHAQYFSKTATKFFALSHQVIHALSKYKTKGIQQINVVHMHDNSKALIAGEIGAGNSKNINDSMYHR